MGRSSTIAAAAALLLAMTASHVFADQPFRRLYFRIDPAASAVYASKYTNVCETNGNESALRGTIALTVRPYVNSRAGRIEALPAASLTSAWGQFPLPALNYAVDGSYVSGAFIFRTSSDGCFEFNAFFSSSGTCFSGSTSPITTASGSFDGQTLTMQGGSSGTNCFHLVAYRLPETSPTRMTVTGLQGPATVTIDGGGFRIDNGPEQTTPGTVQNGDVVSVRIDSFGIRGAKACALVSIGDTPTQVCGPSAAAAAAALLTD